MLLFKFGDETASTEVLKSRMHVEVPPGLVKQVANVTANADYALAA